MTRDEFLDFFKQQPTKGSVNDGEAFMLYELGAGVPQKGIAAEIGSWMGRSSTALALGLKTRGGVLHTIDDHRGLPDYPEMPYGDQARAIFFANLERAGVRQVVDHHNSSADDLAPAWKQPLDLLFIDGCHDYDFARRDTFNYAPHVKPGGVVAFHDVVMDGVWRTVNQWLSLPGVVVDGVARQGNIAAFKLSTASAGLLYPAKRGVILWCVFHAHRGIADRRQPFRRVVQKLSQNVARRLIRLLDWRRE